jgi:hypothetical protein
MRDKAAQRELLSTNITRSQVEAGEHDHCVVKPGFEDVVKVFTGSRAPFGPGFSTPC